MYLNIHIVNYHIILFVVKYLCSIFADISQYYTTSFVIPSEYVVVCNRLAILLELKVINARISIKCR